MMYIFGTKIRNDSIQAVTEKVARVGNVLSVNFIMSGHQQKFEKAYFADDYETPKALLKAMDNDEQDINDQILNVF